MSVLSALKTSITILVLLAAIAVPVRAAVGSFVDYNNTEIIIKDDIINNNTDIIIKDDIINNNNDIITNNSNIIVGDLIHPFRSRQRYLFL